MWRWIATGLFVVVLALLYLNQGKAQQNGDLEQRVSALETTVADVDEFAYGPNAVPDMSLSPMFDPNYTFFVRCEARDQPYSYRDYAYLSCERIVPPLSN